MVSVMEKEFIVSDWFNGAKIFKAKTVNEAAQELLGQAVVPTQDHSSSLVFGCELTEEVRDTVLTKELGVDQSEALAVFPGVKHFIGVNA